MNKGGQSKPSEPSDPIIAKDRKGTLFIFLYVKAAVDKMGKNNVIY